MINLGVLTISQILSIGLPIYKRQDVLTYEYHETQFIPVTTLAVTDDPALLFININDNPSN